jgi:hypothetical protein
MQALLGDDFTSDTTNNLINKKLEQIERASTMMTAIINKQQES